MSLRLLQFLSILFILVLPVIPLSGQATNPFELKRHIEKQDSIITSQSDTGAQSVANPFSLRQGMGKNSGWSPLKTKINLLDWMKAPGDPKIKESDVQSLLFWSLLFLSFLLAIALNINRSVTIKLYRSLLNLNFLSLLYRESKEGNLLIYYLLYGLYFIGFSLFIYLSIIHFKGIKAPLYILHITVYILTIYGIRHLSLKMIGYIYGVHKEADRYLFSIVIFSCIMSIVLIPADFIIAFVNPDLGRRCIWLIFIIFVILYLYRQFREIIFSVSLWRQHIFHFFLYLCTFEIAPLALIIIFLSRQGVL
jgi:hypothetical protein